MKSIEVKYPAKCTNCHAIIVVGARCGYEDGKAYCSDCVMVVLRLRDPSTAPVAVATPVAPPQKCLAIPATPKPRLVSDALSRMMVTDINGLAIWMSNQYSDDPSERGKLWRDCFVEIAAACYMYPGLLQAAPGKTTKNEVQPDEDIPF